MVNVRKLGERASFIGVTILGIVGVFSGFGIPLMEQILNASINIFGFDLSILSASAIGAIFVGGQYIKSRMM